MGFGVPNSASASFAPQAELDAVDLEILAAAHAGTGVVTGCAVTAQGTPNMTLAVASGTVVVAGTSVSVSSGNVTITAAAVLPRFDLVVVNSSGTKSVTAGTAAAQPVFPAIPANSVVLAAVYVPGGDTAIGSTQIVDKRVSVVDLNGTYLGLDEAGPRTLFVSDDPPDDSEGSDGDLWWPSAPTAISGLTSQITFKPTDKALTSNTVVEDDAGFEALDVEANGIYIVKGFFIYDGDTAGDFKLIWRAPAGSSMDWATNGPVAGATSSLHEWRGQYVDLASSFIYGAVGAGTKRVAQPEGILIVGSTAGTIKPQWAQGTSSATATTLYARSHYSAVRIA